MGLGIYIKGDIKRSIELESIEEYITARSSGFFKEALSFSYNEHTLYATIHPCEETVEFGKNANALFVSAKTNSVGPGYHAYLVELIERIGNDLGIEWHWDLEEGDQHYQDETGYYAHRDFELLQTEMLRWMEALASTFSNKYQEGDNKQLMISFPMGYPRMQLDYFAASPLGIWTKEWFDKVSGLPLEKLSGPGKDFFIWWNKGTDALFYKNTGIALLNIECPWHYPMNDHETAIFSNIHYCFTEARRKDPQIELPEEDWVAVKQFLMGEEVFIPETVWGFKKNVMTFDLGERWMIDLPGDFYYDIEDGSEIFWNEVVTVRNTSFSMNEKGVSETAFAEDFFTEENNPGAEFLYSDTDVIGKAAIYYYIDKEEDDEYWILQGVKVKGEKFLLSTISYPSEEDKDWAIETWNTIKYVG